MTSPSAAPANARRRSGQYATTLAAFGVLLGSARARAQSNERVTLTWQAPAGCPSADDVRARVRELAGAASAAGSQLRAEATVMRGPDGRFHLKLIVHADETTGERHIDGRSCEDLAGAAAVNLVLLLESSQPSAANRAAPPNHREGDAAVAAPDSSQPAAARAQNIADPESDEPQAPAAPPAPQSESSPRTWRALLQLPLASVSFGPLPQPSFGFALGAGIRLGGWTLLAEAGAWLQQTLPAAAREGVSADVDRVDASLRTCHTFPSGSFELAPCIRVSLRHIWVRGSGAHVSARTEEATWIAPGIGAQVGLPLGDWLRLVAGLDAQLETSRPRISIDGVGEVDQLSPASVTFAVGTEWIL